MLQRHPRRPSGACGRSPVAWSRPPTCSTRPVPVDEATACAPPRVVLRRRRVLGGRPRDTVEETGLPWPSTTCTTSATGSRRRARPAATTRASSWPARPRAGPAHDDRETIANCWIRPADALERHQAGDFDLILPTISNLEAIGRFATADDLLAAAAAAERPARGRRRRRLRILLPGDPGTTVRDRPWPTPRPRARSRSRRRSSPASPARSARSCGASSPPTPG